MAFTIEIQVPPSINNAFANAAKGRVKTRDYKAWRDSVGWAIKSEVPASKRVAGPFAVWINLPCALAGDIDNRIKPIVDALVASGRVDDDQHMTEVHVCRAAPTHLAIVTVKPGLKVSAA